MGLFGNKDKNIVNEVELKEDIKQEILQGYSVEIAVPTIKTITDSILAAKEETIFGNRPLQAAKGGVGTVWNLTKLIIGAHASSIELGGKLIPHFMVNSLMKHPIYEMRYGFILDNGEIINLEFQDELQKEACLEVLKEEYGLSIIE